MNTNRLETFADGVFAIAATLLILNVDAQVTEDVPDLGDDSSTSGRPMRRMWSRPSRSGSSG